MGTQREEEQSHVELCLEQVRDSYSHLRLIDPGAESRMERSMRTYGQISPAVVARGAEELYEMIDGFKRLRACHRLGISKIKVTALEIGTRGLKAAMVELNRKSGSLRPIEEALVVQSLHREDRLAQVEIATLLGRDKSWVSRRIQMVERLCEEVLEHIRLGLIRVSMSRHLGRLPRGNQPNTLSTILKYRFTCRETERLVAMLLERPRWEQEAVLRFPEPILSDRTPCRPKKRLEQKTVASLQSKLEQMGRLSLSITEILETLPLASLDEAVRTRLGSVTEEVQERLNRFRQQMEQPLL